MFLTASGALGQTIEHDLPADQNLTGEHRSTQTDLERADEFTFYFRCNQTTLDETYLWNSSETAMLRGLLKRSGFCIDTLTIYAYSSPEGPYSHNVWLSRKRAETTRDYILAQHLHIEISVSLVNNRVYEKAGRFEMNRPVFL